MAQVKGKMGGLRWVVRRLRAMGPAELVHRVGEQCALRVMQVQHRIGRKQARQRYVDVSAFEFCFGTKPRLPELQWSFPKDPALAEQLLAGKLPGFGFEWQWRPEAGVWHAAPDTGREWPSVFFGAIRYRPGNPYGDIRIAWEPARLQQLVGLALLAKQSSPEISDRAVALLEAQLLSWVEANRFGVGIHYISAMECALRLIAVCHALDLVREKLQQPDRIWPTLVGLVESHAALIAKRLSLHSSAGNHTIAEAAGLVYAGFLFPELQGATRWRSRGLALLEEEANHQILPDGGGVEQAFGYLRFILDLYGLVMELLDCKQRMIPQTIRAAVQRGGRFLGAMQGGAARPPSIGDDDRGAALSPYLRWSWDQTGWDPGWTAFKESGYSLFCGDGSPSGRTEKSTLLFDHGGLGMAPLYGHGHADALSVTLRRGETEMLVDPGTYTYNGEARWRAYFRGTAAHNTVTVDGLDQAVQESPFIWSKPFRAKIVRREEIPGGGVRLLARHNGYARIGVTHWRAVVYQPPRGWLIWDWLSGEGEHTLELHWHLGLTPEKEGTSLFLSHPTERLSLSVEGGDLTLHRGETEPILGWQSPGYGIKEPITTARVRYRGSLPHEFITRIGIPSLSEKDPGISEALSLLRRWVS
ncbi:MAG: alginate lyase family protein [Nitrospirae bacterium]|nr:alginate lyase family protein [Candidatus Manganitrophaceae bacterium]